jgi:arylsulfatase
MWELYNIDDDFSQPKDLAKQNPEKLAALEHLWWAEAARKNILPLDWRGADRFSGQLTGKPNLAAGRDRYVYRSGLTLLPEAAAPDLKNKSFTLSADVQLKQGDEGMLFTQGGFTGGWAFMVQNGKLVLVHNYIDLARYRVESSEPLPAGSVNLTAHFDYGGGKQLGIGNEMGQGGKVTLTANGKVIGSGEITKTAPFRYSLSEGQDIGRDEGTPVDNSYKPPFAFTGKILAFTVDLR